jgi:hypothetical protein
MYIGGFRRSLGGESCVNSSVAVEGISNFEFLTRMSVE